ncbi:MAG: hypothetical protein J1G05_05310 [Clostridiales bacterium]|nr:hypothetical protein [Clostridiales bacterium]
MTKEKFIKKLISIGVAAVSAFSVFGITACSSCGNKGTKNSNQNAATSLSAPKQLATPEDLITSTYTKKLSWTGDVHASGYTVYEKLSTATTFTEHLGITSCEYDLTGLAAGTYELYVKAIGDGINYTDSEKSQTITYVSSGVSDELTVAEYAAGKAAEFAAKYTNLTDEILGDLGADVPVNEHKNNILSASTKQAVDEAYKAGESACDAKILENAKSAAIEQIVNYRSDESFNTNATAWNEAQETAIAAINAATTVDDVKTALNEGEDVLCLMENDTQATVADIAIQIFAVIDGELKGKIGELKIKSGNTVTVEQIEKACDFTLYDLEGVYEEAACINKIVGSKTYTSSDELTVTIYAKLKVKIDLTASITYAWSVSGSKISASQNVTEGMLVWNNGKGTDDSATNTGGSDCFKFESNNAVIIVTLKLKAGQKVTVTANTKSGSNNGAFFGYFATGVILTSAKKLVPDGEDVTLTNSENIDLGNNSDTNYADYVVEYTVETDGEVVIRIKRVKNTVQLKTLTVVVSGVA